jgi:hypothetical protein
VRATGLRPGSALRRSPTDATRPRNHEAEELGMVALSVILFPPLLIAFLLVMERVEEPLRRPATPREVTEFIHTATPGEVGTLASSGIRRALFRWRRRRRTAEPTGNPPLV